MPKGLFVGGDLLLLFLTSEGGLLLGRQLILLDGPTLRLSTGNKIRNLSTGNKIRNLSTGNKIRKLALSREYNQKPSSQQGTKSET